MSTDVSYGYAVFGKRETARERVARAIFLGRPDCKLSDWPATPEQRRAYSHAPSAAIDLSFAYADEARRVFLESVESRVNKQSYGVQERNEVCEEIARDFARQ